MPSILQHYLNPLHIYCRLRDIGMTKELATCLCRFYERFIFKCLSGREQKKQVKLKFFTREKRDVGAIANAGKADMEDSTYRKLDELKESSKKHIMIIHKMLRKKRPELFSLRAEDYRSTRSPLQERVISLAYYRKMKSMYRRFRMDFPQCRQITLEIFCKRREMWLKKEQKKRLIRKIADRELTKRGLPPVYEKDQPKLPAHQQLNSTVQNDL